MKDFAPRNAYDLTAIRHIRYITTFPEGNTSIRGRVFHAFSRENDMQLRQTFIAIPYHRERLQPATHSCMKTVCAPFPFAPFLATQQTALPAHPGCQPNAWYGVCAACRSPARLVKTCLRMRRAAHFSTRSPFLPSQPWSLAPASLAAESARMIFLDRHRKIW